MESVSKTRDFYTLKRSLSYYHSNVTAVALSQPGDHMPGRNTGSACG